VLLIIIIVHYYFYHYYYFSCCYYIFKDNRASGLLFYIIITSWTLYNSVYSMQLDRLMIRQRCPPMTLLKLVFQS